ncbi:MAG: ABC transporter permease subunit [Luteitalea sp.]|nr:ABC transporter permease subunit [Luteitalea sp.]
MIRYLVRRLFFALFLVFAVSSSSLILTRLAPGDFVVETLGVGVSRDVAEQARIRYGLDQPIATQYGRWLLQAARFDFGRSLAYDRPVADLVPERAFNTALLALSALLLATLVGLPLGVVTGTRGGLATSVIRAASVVLVSMPPLLTSLLLVFAAARTGWLPIGGMRSVTSDGALLDLVRHMIVPVLALALPIGAMFERLQAQAMRQAVSQPFVIATRARGVSRRRIIWRDALKVGLRPIASVYGLVIGTLLSGSFAVEIVTAWPGLGRLMLDALRARDVYLVAACAAAGSIFLAAGTLLSDAALVAVDPRFSE